MTTLQKLSTYGPVFQVKVLGALLTQRQFLINVIDSVDSEYFESSAHKWVVEYIQKYFSEYHTTPTVETLSIEVKKLENEVLRISIAEALREAYKMSDNSDLEWVEAEFSTFCRNQQVKKAILNSVSLLEMNDFESILQLISKAVNAGEDKTVGLDYNIDIEARYREDDRRCIPFPWPVFNEITQGGYGKGDLVLVFGNPGGGKSWAITAMGAYAAALGYNVVHYSLELGAVQYVSEITGADLKTVANWFIFMLIFVFDPLAIALVIATNQAFEQRKPKVNIYGETKPIEPIVEFQPITSKEEIEQEKQAIQFEIDKIQRSGVSGRKSGPAIEQLQNRLRDLDNTITY